MSRVWNSRATMRGTKLKVKLRSPQQRRSPTKYGADFEGEIQKITGKKPGKKRAASPAVYDDSPGPSPGKRRSREPKKKTTKQSKRRSSSSSSLSSLSSVSRSRSRSSSSSSSEEVFGKTNRKSPEIVKKSKKAKHKSHRRSHKKSPYMGENASYYQSLEDGVNREKRADKCRTSKKAIQFIDHTKNRSTTYLKRSGSLILASKELEIQTHCHISLHIQPTWSRGKQYRYLSGSNVHPIRSAEYADRWVGPNMCHVCGEQRETSLWLFCGHASSRRKQGCNYRVHCHCIGLYYSSAIELGQVPFYCPKHGRYHKMKSSIYYDEMPVGSDVGVGIGPDMNGAQRQLSGMEVQSNAESVVVRNSNNPLGSELIHVIDSTTGLRSAVRVDSTTASGTEMLLHFHSSIVQSAEMTGDPSTAMVLELQNEDNAVPVSQVSGNVIPTHITQANIQTDNTITHGVKTDIVNAYAEHQEQLQEDPNTEQQYEEVHIKQEYDTVEESQQVVTVEEVQMEPVVQEQVVHLQEVQVAGESNEIVTTEGQQVVAIEEIQMSEHPDVMQGSEQIVVQEVEMEGEYATVQDSEMVMQNQEVTEQQLASGQVVFVSASDVQGDSSERVVFQMANESYQQTGEEITVYSHEPAESDPTDNSNPEQTRVEIMSDPNTVSESDGTEIGNLPPGTEIVHMVDSNTAMVLEVQSEASAVPQ